MAIVSDDCNYIYVRSIEGFRRFPLNKMYRVDTPFEGDKVNQILNYDENSKTILVQTYLNGYCISDDGVNVSEGLYLDDKTGFITVFSSKLDCKNKDLVNNLCKINEMELVIDETFIREYYLFLDNIFRFPIYLIPPYRLENIKYNLITTYKKLWDSEYRITERNGFRHIVKKERIESGEYKMHHLRFDKLNLIYLGNGVLTDLKVRF